MNAAESCAYDRVNPLIATRITAFSQMKPRKSRTARLRSSVPPCGRCPAASIGADRIVRQTATCSRARSAGAARSNSTNATDGSMARCQPGSATARRAATVIWSVQRERTSPGRTLTGIRFFSCSSPRGHRRSVTRSVTQHDFNYAILEEVEHRPWPMPHSPWLMTQTWHDLLFAHWPVAVDALRSHVPAGFELDTFDGRAWIAIVPFHMTNVAPRGVPALPWVSAFPELNVRTYVRVTAGRGSISSALMRRIPWQSASLEPSCISRTSRPTCPWGMPANGFTIEASARAAEAAPAEFEGRYRALGSPSPPTIGTLEHFLTERYCLFTVDDAFHAYTLDIHHPPWPLQEAEAEIRENTMAEAAGIRLPSMEPLLHFSKRQDMVAWSLRRISTA